MRRVLRWVPRTVVMVGAVLTVGCAAVAPAPRAAPSDATAHDIREMKERIVELQQRAVMAEVEIDRLRQQVSDLQATGRPATHVPEALPRPAGLDDRVAAPMPPSQVQVDDLPPASAQNSPAPSTATPPMTNSVPTPGSNPRPNPAPAVGTSPGPIPAAGQSIYDRGYTLYHQGRYVDAEAAFQQFLQSYPKTDLADNAQYWIGEARFARRDFSGSMAAFRETVNRYPDGNKVPDALLKIGDCLAETGDRAAARAQFEDVLKRFPGSAASATAEERLAALR